ncbi:MAG: SDR family NAD(P)-dependent oxidoreductase [Planctomycetota bacterium]|nr:SDR family NAD(P)-dependent oxidoreductase [Planctomycetota bacterium]
MSSDPSSTRRRALITGGSSGLGAAVAQILAKAGYRVALLARREEVLRQVCEGLEGNGHLYVPCDLTVHADIARAMEQVDEVFGGLDLLVNNAGIGYRARVEEIDPDTLRGVFDTNVFGMLLACQGSLPLLRKGSKPVVVNVSSVVGRRGIPGQAAYSASKAAVCSIGEALRVEWAPENIAVCTLNPALTATGFFQAQANPSELPDPDLSDADPAEDVARWVLELDRNPQPEVFLRKKWRLLGILSVVRPRYADRLLVRRLGGGWKAPRR